MALSDVSGVSLEANLFQLAREETYGAVVVWTAEKGVFNLSYAYLLVMLIEFKFVFVFVVNEYSFE